MPGSAPKFERATSVMEEQLFGHVRPAVPMPGSIATSKSFSDIVTAATDQVGWPTLIF
jgi:hypothetical protein